MRYLPERDYSVRYAVFPNSSADGVVISNGDGTATIVINRRVCPKRQREALLHELRHLEREDLFSEKDIKEIEAENA